MELASRSVGTDTSSMSFVFPDLPTWLLDDPPPFEFVRALPLFKDTDTQISLLIHGLLY